MRETPFLHLESLGAPAERICGGLCVALAIFWRPQRSETEPHWGVRRESHNALSPSDGCTDAVVNAKVARLHELTKGKLGGDAAVPRQFLILGRLERAAPA